MLDGGTIATRGLLHAPASSGRDLLGGRMQLTFASIDTDGAYTLCVGLTPPGLGPPLHVHAVDDQTHYVVRGTYELVSGADVVIAEQGACVHMPRYIPHTFYNVGDEPAELIEFTVPGGIDRYFDAAAHLGPVAMDIDARNEVGRPFGISFPERPTDYLEPPPGEVRRPTTVVGPGEGRPLDLAGHEAIVKVELQDTGGSHSLLEIELPPRATAILPCNGPAAAIGLEGAFAIEAGGACQQVETGDSVAVPAGMGEIVIQTADLPGRLLVYALEQQS